MPNRASNRIEIETFDHIRIKRLAAAASINFVALTVENHGVADGTGKGHRVLNRQIGKTEGNKLRRYGLRMPDERNADV